MPHLVSCHLPAGKPCGVTMAPCRVQSNHQPTVTSSELAFAADRLRSLEARGHADMICTRWLEVALARLVRAAASPP